MLIFSAKPLQFNKKWLEHSKQFLIVLFKVSNCLIYGYINMMIFHHDVQRLSYSVQSGVFRKRSVRIKCQMKRLNRTGR